MLCDGYGKHETSLRIISLPFHTARWVFLAGRKPIRSGVGTSVGVILAVEIGV